MYANYRLRLSLALLSAWALSQTTPTSRAADGCASAESHFARRSWAEAERGFTLFLQHHPDHAPAKYFLAESLLQQGKHREARTQFLQFLEQHGDHPCAKHAQFRAAEAAYLSGQAEEAQLALTQFRTQYPADALNVYVLPYLAELELTAGRGKESQIWYTEALRQFPQGPLAAKCRFGLGRALELQGATTDARDQYQQLVDSGGPLAPDAQIQIGVSHFLQRQYREAEAALREALQNYPDSPLTVHAQYWLGLTHFARGDWAAAARTFQGAAAHPDHPLSAAVLFHAAQAHRRLHDLEAARAYYERVTADWPRSEWADDSLWALVELARDAGDQPRLEQLAERFVRDYAESPWRPQAQRAVGRARLQRGEYAKAADVFRQLLPQASATEQAERASGGQDPRPAQGPEAAPSDWLDLASACLERQHYEEALEALEQVRAEQRPLRDDVLWARARVRLGLQQYAEAIVDLQQLLSLQPATAHAGECRLRLAIALARSGRSDDGLEIFDRLSEAEAAGPAYLEAAAALAEAAYDAERYDPAQRLFAILAQNGQPEEYATRGRSGLGWTYFRQARLEPALDAFSQLVGKFPASPWAPEAALMKASLLEKLDRLEAAADAYLAVAASYEDSEEAANALLEAARLQEQRDRKADATELLQRLIEHYPAFARRDIALYQRAWLLADQQRLEEADQTFLQLVEEHRDSGYWTEAAYRVARQAAAAAQYARARQWVSELLERRPAAELRAHALYLKGQLAGVAGDWTAVEPPFQQLLAEFPDSPLCLLAEYWRAESCFHQQRWDDAIPAYVRASVESGDPNQQARALLQLGKCYEYKGDAREARRRFDQVVNDYARTPSAEEAFQRLQTLGAPREALQPSDAAGTRR